MKNHPVNNDYVQTLIEGLLNEECSQPLSIDESKAHIKRQLKSKKISPVEKARLKAKLDAKEHDSEKRKEVAQEAADEEFGESGGHHAKMDLWAGNDQGNIRDQGGAERKPKKVKGQKLQTDSVDLARTLNLKIVNEADYAVGTGYNRAQNPENRRALAKKLRKTRSAETVEGAIKGAVDIADTEATETGKPIVGDLAKKAWDSNPAAKDARRRGSETIANKARSKANAARGLSMYTRDDEPGADHPVG